MIKDFLRFVYESKYDSFAAEVASELMAAITSKKSSIVKRRIKKTLEYDIPVTFSLLLTAVRSKTFEPSKTTLFKKIPWEKINFQKHGFAVDANSFIFPEEMSPDPEVEISIVLDPEKEPNSHQFLYYKLLDCVRHEVEHLLQKGKNKQYFHTGSQVDKNRQAFSYSYKYFLLPDEIPAMVSGLKLSADKKGVPIDYEFEEYLFPIRDFGFITDDEAQSVIDRWIKFTIKHFPDAKISKKYRNS